MNPTYLIGLDGATFSVLDPLMENGTMPFLKKFVEGGTRGGLMSTANPLTPPAWISMITGRNPGSHGVFDFIWAEERKKDVYFTLYNFRDIQCETLWSIVSRKGGTVTSLNFPMMSPPPAVNGHIVPGLVSWKHLRLNTHPQELYAKLKALPGFNAKDLAWDFELEKNASKGVPPEEFENWIKFHIEREKRWFEIMKYLMENEPSDLMSIVFDGVDKMLHIGLRFVDPNVFPDDPSPWELKMQGLCFDYFRELDGFLAEICEMAGPEARIFMASDHGFGPSWEVLRINTWLHEKGYLTWKDTGEMDEDGKKRVEKLVDRHFVYLDWEKTTAYARTTTSNGIYIRREGEGAPGGVPAAEYDSFRKKLIEELYTIKDEESGEQIVKKAITKEEAYPGKHNKQAPDLTLVMRDHSFVSILNKTPVVYKRPEIEGTHYPEGIFLASGPGIRRGAVIDPLPMVDVAPSLLYSLGLEVPKDFEGRLPEEVFEEAELAQNPVRTGEATEVPETFATGAAPVDIGAEEEEKIMDKLKALGYVE